MYQTPYDTLRQRLDNLERQNMVHTMQQERKQRGVPSMLQELGERSEWRTQKILYNTHKM